jgi:hypothetical protein
MFVFIIGFAKAICTCDVALEQLLNTAAWGLRKSVNILKHYAKGKIKLYTCR